MQKRRSVKDGAWGRWARVFRDRSAACGTVVRLAGQRLMPSKVVVLFLSRLRKHKKIKRLCWVRSGRIAALSRKPQNSRMGKGTGSVFCTKRRVHFAAGVAG
jgi:hypothetical protein